MIENVVGTNEYSQKYLAFKQELDTELNKAADGFVKIGYLLRRAEDSDILQTSGYRNVTEFAAAEYGLSKDVVSRYININKRYSEGGYAPVLASGYHGYGLAKLAEMLTLPDAVVEAIPAELSKTEIREIKKEYDAEQTVTDIEVAIEAAGQSEEQRADTLLNQIAKVWLHDSTKDFKRLSSVIYPDYDIDKLMDVIAPDETRVIIVRVPGVGRLMMTCSISDKIKIVNMRSREAEKASWEELCSAVSAICAPRYPEETIEEVWARTYDDPYPEEPKEEPKPEPKKEATTQVKKKKEEKKPAKRKESKITVAKPLKKPEVAPVQQEEPEPDEVQEGHTEKQLEPQEVSTTTVEQEKNQVNTKYHELFNCIKKSYERFEQAEEGSAAEEAEKQVLIENMQIMIDELRK